MTGISFSGTGGSTSWVNNLGLGTLSLNFGSAQSNALLIAATAVSSNDSFPYYVYDISDTRGNKWKPLQTIEYGVWANTGSFKLGIPRNLTTQLWYAVDPASPASGYQATASIKSSYTDDSGAPHLLNMDAAIFSMVRLTGQDLTDPLDHNPHSGHLSVVDTTASGVQPTQTNVLASNSTNIAIVSVFGGIGTLNGANQTTNYINNGITYAHSGIRNDVNGFVDGGPANNAIGLVLDVAINAVGPWNLGSNQIQNINSMHCDEMITRIFTADSQPLRRVGKSRIIT